MGRMIFVPQYPTKLRYQEWWYNEFPKQFEKHYDEVLVLGKDYIDKLESENVRENLDMFSPIYNSIECELFQIAEFMKLKKYKSDTLFLADISFPGFFSNVLYHDLIIENLYAYCHATSLNNMDYFEYIQGSKWASEVAISRIFKKVFVATNYHKDKICFNIRENYFLNKNTVVIGFPNSPLKTFKEEKEFDIISVSRPTPQKVWISLENKLSRYFGPIKRKECKTWEEYYKFVSSGKILLSTASEETYGLQVVDAISNNTIPLVPNNYSYPELLPPENLWSNYDDLKGKIISILNKEDKIKVPKLLMQEQADKFYENLINEMKG